MAEADEYIKNALVRIIMGKPEDFDKSWAKIVSDLKAMGIEEANKVVSRLIKEKVEMWNKKL